MDIYRIDKCKLRPQSFHQLTIVCMQLMQHAADYSMHRPGTLYYTRPCIPVYIGPNTLQHYCKTTEPWHYPTITNFTTTIKEILTNKEKKVTDGRDQSPINKM